ncbi:MULTISPECIES: MFS transporter [Bacillales]|uniref:MDR family MFS transporter n=1 Tax=Bacillales TaxID=1385 RepID=UPI000344BB20|nr:MULTISPECIES: MFS transporter [Bacillales]KMZ42423.1 membrane protein [Bacillus sp. FJAT-27238]
MSKMRQVWEAYHPIVHLLMAGTVFVQLTQSMSIPFLAIYLGETTKLSHAYIGLIIGAGPLAGTVGGFVGGILSDLFGRQKLMFFSLLAMACSMIGFISVAHPISLLVISMVMGLAASIFATVSKALMGDLTPEHKRFRVFSNRYLASNLGFAIGPMLGAFLGISGSNLAFILTAVSLMSFAVILVVACRKCGVTDNRGENGEVERASLGEIWQVLRRDVVLLTFVTGGILLVTVYGQMSVTLSQYLRENFSEGVALFGTLMSVNGFTVLLLQIPVTRLVERYSLFARIAGGAVLMAIGEVGFAFSSNWAWFMTAMIVFTLGEILIIPAEYAQIDEISPANMRGTYYGAQSATMLGSFLGPWAGGMVLTAYGGPVMFGVMAVLALVSLIFYWLGRRLHEERKQPRNAIVETAM